MMSDTHAVGSIPAPKAAKAPRKGTSKVLVAALVLVLALAAFAAVMLYGGGMDAAAELLASFGGAQPSPSTPVKQPASAPTTKSAEASKSVESTDPAVPDGPKRQLFYEQIASQETIGELLSNKFGRFEFGDVDKTGSSAKVRVTAVYRGGGSFSGTMVLKKIEKGWFFYTIARDGNIQRLPSSPTYDASVTDAIVDQQYEYQDTIVALIEGGYRTMDITGVKPGSGTKTIGYTLSGGTEPAKDSEAVAISKTIDGATYWFISAIK
jgi:hypothetical protein